MTVLQAHPCVEKMSFRACVRGVFIVFAHKFHMFMMFKAFYF